MGRVRKRKHLPRLFESKFDGAETAAEICKTALQMLIGLVVAVLLVLQFGVAICEHGADGLLATGEKAIRITAGGLGYAAGIELAYMLFTPGPDETVDPVLLGLASLVLIIASHDNIGLPQAGTILLVVLAMTILFFVKAYFISEREAPESNSATPARQEPSGEAAVGLDDARVK